jgi:hypothetical protein
MMQTGSNSTLSQSSSLRPRDAESLSIPMALAIKGQLHGLEARLEEDRQ